MVNGLPLSITIEPTTACNLGCPECPSGLKQFTRAEGNLKTDFYKKIIDEVKQHAFYLNFYFQGEPYINPNFLEMVSYANTKKIYTATSTNAHFLTLQKAEETVKSGLSRLTISIDGTTQETYESYRKGGDLKKVLEGAKNIIEAKKKLNSKTPYVIFQFLVVQPNEHQIEDAKQLATDMGVDEIRFKTAQIYDFENGNPLIPTIEKYARYKKQNDGTYRLKNKLLNECWRMWSSCVITWDGKIVPCCFDKDAKHQLGDLKENTLKQIWLNKKYTDFRKTLLNSRAEIDICQNCTEGTKVFD
ncbi:MAG: SPASM domain-containing protein [Flavobacteriales bacterium]